MNASTFSLLKAFTRIQNHELYCFSIRSGVAWDRNENFEFKKGKYHIARGKVLELGQMLLYLFMAIFIVAGQKLNKYSSEVIWSYFTNRSQILDSI